MYTPKSQKERMRKLASIVCCKGILDYDQLPGWPLRSVKTFPNELHEDPIYLMCFRAFNVNQG